MAEPWNRVNIPMPSVVSCVRIPFDSSTDGRVKSLLKAIETVLTLLRSKALQTEVRLLYELLYVLNNNYRMNKTFRALKQVEQAINRLKEMKLDAALHNLKQLCPTQIQRALGVESGNCDVPSQPVLEWLCLKALGAAQLMGCAMTRCTKACIFARQLLKQEEFVVLNVVLISLLSRLWVFFRGIMSTLAPLYQQLVALRGEVSEARPMPYLLGHALPEDLGLFLEPHGGRVPAVTLPEGSSQPSVGPKRKRRRAGGPVKASVRSKGKMGKEDLGMAVQRGKHLDNRMSPLLEASMDSSMEQSMELPVRRSSRGASALDLKRTFHQRVRAATTFAAVATHLKDMIARCSSLRRERHRRHLTVLLLRSQKMRCLESAGYRLPRRLRSFQQEVLCSPGQVSGAGLSPAALWRSSHPRRSSRRPRGACWGCLSARSRGLGRGERGSLTAREEGSAGAPTDTAPQRPVSCSQDEIDNIFSSIGL